jgi:hypothetical protein
MLLQFMQQLLPDKVAVAVAVLVVQHYPLILVVMAKTAV